MVGLGGSFVRSFMALPCLDLHLAIASAPEIVPYSEIVAFGYFEMPTHLPPADAKVEQVLATFSAEHDQSACGQMPASDSEEQAKYGLDVSYEIPVPDFERR